MEAIDWNLSITEQKLGEILKNKVLTAYKVTPQSSSTCFET